MQNQIMQQNTQKDKPYPFKHGSQCDRIVQYLLAGNRVNNWEIREKFGCLSHTARISEIRKHGYNVQSRQIGTSGTWEYWIVKGVAA